jgi:hypothetical protein
LINRRASCAGSGSSDAMRRRVAEVVRSCRPTPVASA